MVEKNNINDREMLKTFNCGVGFCLIVNKKNIKKIKNVFSKTYKPYSIGFLSDEKKYTRIKIKRCLRNPNCFQGIQK